MKESPIRPCLALVGPTASGKTALALEIARHWPVDIISVDSALVYRGMDIGTAKPSTAEQAQVQHHLIDIRDPLDAYSAADFARDARELIHQIQARGRHPLLVGGTMLYLKALMDGLDELPQADARLRAEIEARAQALGWPALHAELAQVDPASAVRLAPRDAQRIGRALEVWHLTGQPLSALWGRSRAQHHSPITTAQLISLEPHNRAWLHARIERASNTCWRRAFYKRCNSCARVAICIPSCHRCVVSAIDRPGPGLMRCKRKGGPGSTPTRAT
jgi:tRNA dimethylallyltransferase